MGYQAGVEVLIDRASIAKRVDELGKQITADYKDDMKPLLISVLKGSVVTLADLMRAIGAPVQIDFIIVSSYGNADKPGELQLKKDVETELRGRHVIIVDDIVDTGQTMTKLVELFKARGSASVKTCVLLDKPSRRTVEFVPDYCGFEIEDYFVVGYGLDYAERYRNLPDVCHIKET